MSERFYFSGQILNDIGLLDGDQAHHAAQVMRLAPDDSIVLFDGTGQEYHGQVLQVDRKGLRFRVTDIKPRLANPAPEIVIASCLPKGDRQKFMLEKLVELGVDRFIPLTTERSVSVASENALFRLQKGVIEATKQCGRRNLMLLESEHRLDKLCGQQASPQSLKLLADPNAKTSLGAVRFGSALEVVVAVGPEGGFADSETAALVAGGWQPIRIGQSVLRVETAAIAAAAILVSKRDDREI